MRLERLNYNKIKIFLTLDDLTDRGLTKEDLWKDSFKVQQLFKDMMNEANTELGFEANGPIAVEVYSLQAQGMVIIVTKIKKQMKTIMSMMRTILKCKSNLAKVLTLYMNFKRLSI